MISVLLPSRGRPQKMRDAIDNLRTTAGKSIQILVAADYDDGETANAAMYCADHLYVAGERYGYSRLNEYYNELSIMARGEWQLLWNDDSVMLTMDWAHKIEALPKNIMVAELKDQLWPGLVCFPAVRQDAVRAVGGFSLHTQHCDTYWQEIGRRSATNAAVEVYLRHERYDLTGLNNDQTFKDSQAGYLKDGRVWDEVSNQINLDVNTILGLL